VGLAFLTILPKGVLDWLAGVWDICSHVKGAIFQIGDFHLDRIALLVGRQGIDMLKTMDEACPNIFDHYKEPERALEVPVISL
jgi:hypothetical protein